MPGKLNWRLAALGAMVGALLLVPALAWGQAKDDQREQFKARKVEIIKSLQLPPDREKDLEAIENKYAKEREAIIAGLRTADADLEEALKASKPDEGKVKGLVSAITRGQERLFTTFKNQRDEELVLMTPVQQAKYLTALSHWRHQMEGKKAEE